MKWSRRLIAAATLAFILSSGAMAQLTQEQKQEDFLSLVALYAKQYAFYSWKVQAAGFDLLSVQPWLNKLAQTTDDLGYYEIAGQYVGSLKDGHDLFLGPSDFAADLGFEVDIYDGKVLVDQIDTAILSPRLYNVVIGDQLISVDGKSPQEFIDDYSQYQPLGNAATGARANVQFATYRPQAINPRAALVGDSAVVVLQESNGTMKTLTIPWHKTGTVFTTIGPAPSTHSKHAITSKFRKPTAAPPNTPTATPSASGGSTSTAAQTFYRTLTRRFQLNYIPRPFSFSDLDVTTPVYRRGLPATFKQRLGNGVSSYFFSGTYTSGNYKIGLIRIPDFCASDPSCSGNLLEEAVGQFQSEIAYMKQNTDGLVVDVMSNPGGYGYYALQLLDRLTDKLYTEAGMTVRPQYFDIISINETLDLSSGVPLLPWQIDLLTAYRDELQAAYQSTGGETGPLPLDFGWSLNPSDTSSLSFDHPPILDSNGQPVGYNKPVLVLVDQASFSAAELFSAAFQDSGRGLVVGMPTGGLGGGREDTPAGVYAEAGTSVTVEQLLRSHPIVNPNFPTAPYIENIGVIPDMSLDYMTVDNLMHSGKTFVNSFTQILVNQLPAN